MKRRLLNRSRCAGATLRPLALSSIALLSGVAAGCGGGQELAMVGTPDVDSVYGGLETEAVEGGQTLVTVELDELPPADRLGEGYTSYVAWVTAEGGQPEWVGELTYESGARKGRLSATTPHERFTFTVTAEASAHPEAPGELVVAEQHVAPSE
jgi:hypothetical protein